MTLPKEALPQSRRSPKSKQNQNPKKLSFSMGLSAGASSSSRAGAARGKLDSSISSAAAAAVAAIFEEADDEEPKTRSLEAVRAKDNVELLEDAQSLAPGFSKESEDAEAQETNHRARSRSQSRGGVRGGREGRGPTFASGVLNIVVNQKRMKQSDRNPHHDGLEAIKAEVLRERGIDRRKDRKRRRSSSSQSSARSDRAGHSKTSKDRRRQTKSSRRRRSRSSSSSSDRPGSKTVDTGAADSGAKLSDDRGRRSSSRDGYTRGRHRNRRRSRSCSREGQNRGK